MRIVSLRCNGLVSAVKQGLTEWLASKDADLICLQDIRVREYKVINDARFCPEGFVPFYFEVRMKEEAVLLYSRVIHPRQ